jgi:hypothetical protein
MNFVDATEEDMRFANQYVLASAYNRNLSDLERLACRQALTEGGQRAIQWVRDEANADAYYCHHQAIRSDWFQETAVIGVDRACEAGVRDHLVVAQSLSRERVFVRATLGHGGKLHRIASYGIIHPGIRISAGAPQVYHAIWHDTSWKPIEPTEDFTPNEELPVGFTTSAPFGICAHTVCNILVPVWRADRLGQPLSQAILLVTGPYTDRPELQPHICENCLRGVRRGTPKWVPWVSKSKYDLQDSGWAMGTSDDGGRSD